MRANHTQAVFDATAANYDQDRMLLIPGWEALYAAALELIPRDATRILELGTGSGLFSAMIRSAHPRAELYMVDFSDAMLAQARARLGDGEGLHYLLADYTAAGLPTACDAVVSALSIHHLEDDRKQLTAQRAFESLRRGGVFINADHIAGPTPALEAIYATRWLAAVRAAGATTDQIEASLFRQREDRRSPIDPQLQHLRGAGFIEVDCWYKGVVFAVMTGRRD